MKMYNVVFLAEDGDYLLAGPLTYEAADDYCEHAEKYYEIDGATRLYIERAEDKLL